MRKADVEEVVEDVFENIVKNSNLPRPAPELMHIQNMEVDVEHREIYVGGEIEDNFGSWFTCTMRYLENQNKNPITIWLNTPGGSVTSMFTFHDIVRASKCRVRIIAAGQVCSAGVLMLVCGHERYVTESTVLMSHRAAADELSGNLEQMESYIKTLRWQEEHWAELMARYTPDLVDGRMRDQRYWFQLGKKNAEWWVLGGDNIVKEGLADDIYHG